MFEALKTTKFRRLDLPPSSGGIIKGENIVCWTC